MGISRILLTFPYAENSCEINPSHMVFMIFNFAVYLAWLKCLKVYARKCLLYGFPCEMDFSPLVSESHSRRFAIGRDSETRGEKNPSHMENHTKCISSNGLAPFIRLVLIRKGRNDQSTTNANSWLPVYLHKTQRSRSGNQRALPPVQTAAAGYRGVFRHSTTWRDDAGSLLSWYSWLWMAHLIMHVVSVTFNKRLHQYKKK